MSRKGPFPLQRLPDSKPPAYELESAPILFDESSSVILRMGGLRLVSPLHTPFRTDPHGPIGPTVGSADLFPSRMPPRRRKWHR
jgi:hypothetical protein